MGISFICIKYIAMYVLILTHSRINMQNFLQKNRNKLKLKYCLCVCRFVCVCVCLFICSWTIVPNHHHHHHLFAKV